MIKWIIDEEWREEEAEIKSVTVLVGGKPVQVAAVNINGNNFIKLWHMKNWPR